MYLLISQIIINNTYYLLLGYIIVISEYKFNTFFNVKHAQNQLGTRAIMDIIIMKILYNALFCGDWYEWCEDFMFFSPLSVS